MFKLKFLACLMFVAPFSLANAQNSPDSAVYRSDSLRIFQDRSAVSLNTMGTYGIQIKDWIAMQTYSGFDVSNVVRGHVPNWDGGPNAISVSPSLRGGSSAMIIDGVLFNNSIGTFYNTNAFEFQSIGVVSSGNALALFGGAGANGGVILESKNGKGATRPTFEINSFTTYSTMEELQTVHGDWEAEKQWMFTNSASYAQDFGKQDLRISYSNTFLPDDNTDSKTGTDRNAVKINAGFDITERLSARFIGDARYSYESNKRVWSNTFLKQPGLNGNLALRFQATDWLLFSSQSDYADVKQNVSLGSEYFSDSRQKQALSNVTATITPHLGNDFKFSFMIGGQIQRHALDKTDIYFGSSYKRERKIKTRSGLARVSADYKKVIFANVDVRDDFYVDTAKTMNNQPTYSANAVFDFTEGLKIRSAKFNSGRIRMSVGHTNALEVPTFPYSMRMINYYGSVNYDASKPTRRRSFETGFDLELLHSRILLNATYFNNVNNQTVHYHYLPEPDRWIYFTGDFGKMHVTGTEVSLGLYAVKKQDIRLLTKFIYGKYDLEIDGVDNPDPIYRLNPPDWSGSLLTQLEIKSFFATALLVHQQGGLHPLFEWTENGLEEIRIDQTQSALRDISLGYQFPKVTVSLSARNIWRKLKDERSDSDEYAIRVQKTVTASISVKI